MLESFLGNAGDEFQIQVVRRLATFPQYVATKALVQYAVLPESVIVRDEAAKALKSRPMYEYVPLLLSGLSAAIESQYDVKQLPDGRVIYNHIFIRETSEQRNVAMTNHVVQPLWVPRINSLPVRATRGNRLQLVAVVFDDTIARAAESRAEYEKAITSLPADPQNRRIFKALATTTEQSQPEKPSAWWNWWDSHNEYEWPKPTYYSYASETTQQYVEPVIQVVRKVSCFYPGTLVRTETGPAPIESLQAGDRVLSQDQETGELAYKVVLRTTLRPPAAMARITAGGETIMTTLGHPFWISGHGWKMVKQLTQGELLHTLHGSLPIEAAAPLDGKFQAHNLVVDDFNTYFVGQAGLLVHDNEFRRPTRAIVPGFVAEEGSLAAK